MKDRDISKYFFLVIIFAVMFLEMLSQNLTRQSPLYINLMEQSAYIRRGFNRTDLKKIPNPIIDNEWVSFGKGARIIRNAPLQNLRRSSLFTPQKNEVEEFTIIIPVEFSREALEYLNDGAGSDILHTAGVYFSGIGENWEIYFNGNLILSEMHLDEVGRIVSQRFWRDLYFPINKKDIAVGINILALRILGNPALESTGLRSRVHYIDDYRYILEQQRSFFQIVQCAIFVFSALIFLLIFFFVKSRQEIYYLWFSIFSLMICVYTIMRHGTINAFIPNSYISRLAEYLSLMLVIITYSIFVEILLRGKIGIFLKSYYIFCTVLAFTQIFIFGHWGEEAIMLFDLIVFIYIIYFVFYDILYHAVINKKKQSRAEIINLPQSPGSVGLPLRYVSSFYVIAGTLIVCFCGFFEIVGFVFLFDLLPFKISTLFINSTIAVQIGMTFMLSRRFGVLYTQLKQSNIVLESTVKERTRELEEQTVIAVEASRAKSEFLATINHEMKTPLTIIATDIELAEGYVEDGNFDTAKKLMREAWQETMQMADHVTRTIGFSRSHELSRVMQDIDLAAVVEVTLKVFEPLIKKHGNNLVKEIDSSPVIWGNADMLTGVLINLLTNANHHTQNGIINVKGAVVDSHYCLEVSDNGEGISAEMLPHVFERGVSGSGSTGLGLTIVKGIMETHKGEISITSEPDRGTSVKLLFTVLEGQAV